MPVCSIVKTITLKCCRRADALLHKAERFQTDYPQNSFFSIDHNDIFDL